MKQRAVIFAFIIILAIVVVAWGVLFSGGSGLLVKKSPVEVSVVHASSLDRWLEAAADEFNKAGAKVDGHPVKVRLNSMDGVEAMSKIGKGELDADGLDT